MRTVWKFGTRWESDDFTLTMPRGAQVVHGEAVAYGSATAPRVVVWAAVDTDAPLEDRDFYVRGTGHPVPDDAHHIATCQDGPFVWHLFERAAVAR